MNKIVMKAAMLTACLMLSSGMFLFSQQGSKGKSEVKKEVRQVNKPVKTESTDVEQHKVVKQAKDHDIEEAERDNTRVEDGEDPKKSAKVKDTTGHAYGTYRDEMHRKTVQLGSSVEHGNQKVKEARVKIDKAKVKLEDDRKAGKVSDAEYNEKKEKIRKAEEAVNKLEDKVEAGRELEKPLEEPME